MAVQEKVDACEFSAVTTLGPDQIAQGCDRAAQAAKVTLGSSVHKEGASDDAILFKVRGPGGIYEFADFIVSWSEETGGSRTVTLRVGNYTTAQDQVFSFIPIGPKRAPAVKSLQRFGSFLKEELAR